MNLSAPRETCEIERLRTDFGWDISNYANYEQGIWFCRQNEIRRLSYPHDGNESCLAHEDNSMWFEQRNQIILQAINRFFSGSCIWDVGSGNGFVAQAIQSNKIEVVAVEPARAGAIASSRRGVVTNVCGFLDQFYLPSDSLQAVGCFDVIEHLADPQEFLVEIRRILRPGGLLLLTVPALPSLWSHVDIVAGHFRRYTKSSLGSEIERSGFVSLDIRYFFFFMLVPIFLFRRLPFLLLPTRPIEEVGIQSVRELGATSRTTANPMLKMAFKMESALAHLGSAPLGTSLLGVFVKR